MSPRLHPAAEPDSDEPANWLAHRVDGKVVQFSVMAVALLYGLPPDQIDPHAPLSEEQWKVGRRRTKEAQAATGSDELVDVLWYWARAERGMDVLDLGDWVTLLDAGAM
jgi:hypothetical protein